MRVSWVIQGMLFVALVLNLLACGNEAPPMGEAIKNRDSLPVMITHGVSKLISDSGVIRYKLIAEEWEVYDKTIPQRQYFPKGIYLERYDNQFDVNLTITADTAYCFNQNLWKMRGRVAVVNKEDGTQFYSDELYWDMAKHQLSSYTYFHIITPDKDLEGNWFQSDENLSRYHVKRTSGFVPMVEQNKKSTPADTLQQVRDSADVPVLRPAPVGLRKKSY